MIVIESLRDSQVSAQRHTRRRVIYTCVRARSKGPFLGVRFGISLHVTYHLLLSELRVHPLIQALFQLLAQTSNMGSFFGDVSIETVVTVAIVAAAAGFATVQFTSPAAAAPQSTDPQADTSKPSKKKAKAKAKVKDEPKSTLEDTSKAAHAAVEAIPGDFNAPKVDITASEPLSSSATSLKKKNKGKKKKGTTTDSQTLSSSGLSIPDVPQPSKNSATPKQPLEAPVAVPEPAPQVPPRTETPESAASESDELSDCLAVSIWFLITWAVLHRQEELLPRVLPRLRAPLVPYLLRVSLGETTRMATTLKTTTRDGVSSEGKERATPAPSFQQPQTVSLPDHNQSLDA